WGVAYVAGGDRIGPGTCCAPEVAAGGGPLMVDTTRVRNLVGTNRDGVGTSPRRPDGVAKVTGEFAYSSDMWMEDMLWGATLRSPHPHARIRGIDVTEALKVPGVHAVLTHEDVPGDRKSTRLNSSHVSSSYAVFCL